jgi:hypothetical protein
MVEAARSREGAEKVMLLCALLFSRDSGLRDWVESSCEMGGDADRLRSRSPAHAVYAAGTSLCEPPRTDDDDGKQQDERGDEGARRRCRLLL